MKELNFCHKLTFLNPKSLQPNGMHINISNKIHIREVYDIVLLICKDYKIEIVANTQFLS